MIIKTQVRVEGVRVGDHMHVDDAPVFNRVTDPSLRHPVGKVLRVDAIADNLVEITMELDDSAVAARLNDLRGVF